MKIPKQFELFGQTINVEYTDKLVSDRDSIGLAIYRENRILLQKATDGIIRTKEMIEQTFLHELFHFILFEAGEVELMDNEKFVDIISSLFHQFLKTSKGELK